MYRTHWGLRELPFRSYLDARFFFESPTHEEALARLYFLVEERRRVGLLLGESGSGKSLVLEVFARRLRRRGAQVANVHLLGLDVHEFLWLLAAELGLNPDRQEDSFRLWRSISDRIAENRYQQWDTVVLLDDADEARPEVLDQVARLAQSDQSSTSRLMLVVAGCSDQLHRLGSRILERAELRIDLERWLPADTVAYINTALQQAGRNGPAFTDEALARLQELSGGVPRRVSQIANLSLLAGAGQQLPQIDVATVEAVYTELTVAARQSLSA